MEGKRICVKCGQEKPLNKDHFHFYKNKFEGTCIECKRKCSAEYRRTHPNENKKYREDNKESIKQYNNSNLGKNCKFKSRGYKLNGQPFTIQDYNNLLEKQKGRCAICLKEIISHIDHNHETGEVRGLLCHNCNVGIGKFNDSIELLNNAIVYLNGSK